MSDDRTIIFNDMWGTVYGSYPIVLAKNFKPQYEILQKDKYNRVTFTDCPGMFDYKNQGWIMTTWCDIEIFSDGVNNMVYYSNDSRGGTKKNEKWPDSAGQQMQSCPFNAHATGMSEKIIDGVTESTTENGPLKPMHMTSPWAVETNGNSLLVLPPTYHSSIGNDILIYPGIVDYKPGFHTLNIIFTVRKPGEYHIKAGTPLVHLIPLRKEEWTGYYAHDHTSSTRFTGTLSKMKQWYRRLIQINSKYTMERYTK